MDWKTECCIKGCLNKVRASGFCNHHYMQWSRHGHPLHQELSNRKLGHRKEGTLTYRIWTSMRSRCNGSRRDYGGRGISVCDRWKVFVNFLDDMGECPEGHSIERIDNNGNYEPNNCKWATVVEQNQNKRNVKLTNEVVIEARKRYANGEPACELATSYGVKYHTMFQAVTGRSWRHLTNG